MLLQRRFVFFFPSRQQTLGKVHNPFFKLYRHYIHTSIFFSSVYFLFRFISPFQPINSIQTRISSLKLAACQPNLLSLCTKTLFDFLKKLFSYESVCSVQDIFWIFIVLKLKMNCNSKNRKPKVFRMINLFCLVVMLPWKLTAKTEGALILSFGFNAFRLALISNVKADALQDSCLNLVLKMKIQ